MQDRLERMCMVGMRKTIGKPVTMFSFWVDIIKQERYSIHQNVV